MSKHLNQMAKYITLFAVAFLLVLQPTVSAAASPRGQGDFSPVIVILPFQVNAGGSLQQLATELPTMLGEEFVERGIRVVSPDNMMQALRRSNATVIDTTTARQIGSLAGATHIVFGTINQAGTNLSLDARMVPVRSGKVSPYFIDQGSGARDVRAITATLAQRIAASFAPGDAISAIEVRGTRILDQEVVLMRINSRPGDRVDSTMIDNDMKVLWDLGYFSDVQVDLERRDGKVTLVYIVEEKPRVESIAVEGASQVSESDILAVMSIKQGSIYNEKLLSEDLGKITELYRKKGYSLASVSPRIDQREGGANAALIIAVNEGNKQYIADVRLEGVSQMSESDVLDEMLLTSRGWFSWISGTGILKEELIERDSTAITSYYLNHGFLDIVVGAAKVSYDEEGIVVTFPINEGQRYTLGEITFAGDFIAPEEDLRNMIALDELATKNEYFNLSVMQEDQKILTNYYARHGYGYADINPSPQKRGDGIVDVIYHVEKRQKLYINRVLVEGNSKTRNNVIMREMRLTDGDVFEGDKLRRSNQRINRLDFFEMAEIELVPTSREDEVDLKVKVKEKPTGALMAGVGYSTFSSVGVGGTLMERNLFGKGYMAAFQAGFNSRRNAYTFSFTNPRLYDTELSLGVDLYHWRDDYIDYRKRTTGGNVRLSYPIGEYTSVGVSYRLDQYKIYDLDDDVSSLIRRYDTGHRFSSVGTARIVRDSTDSRQPTSGNIDYVEVSYGGGILGGDDDFITVTAEHQSYYQLWKNHVLHGRVKGAVIFENGNKYVPVFERFWMGGINSVRGYDSRDIVPRDPITDDRIGGTHMAFANFEYIWTFSEEVGMSVVPFFDIGFNLDDDHNWSWNDEIKKSVGAELRWRSPLGDLRFAYGIPLDDDRHGKRRDGRFEFSMGQTF